MGETVELSRSAIDAIVTEAIRSAEEVCGLLLGATSAGSHRVTDVAPCRNVAADPARRFEIDTAALIAAHRAARSGGPAIVGHYHSHPSGTAVPSARDAAAAAPDGLVWLIVAGRHVTAWRAVRDGAVEGRFDPLTLIVAD